MAKQIVLIESKNSMKIRFQNSNLVLVDEHNKIVLQHSVHKIFLVIIIGEISITSVLIKEAKKHAMPLFFLNYNLKVYHVILPSDRGNFLLKKKQYICKNNLDISKKLVDNKAKNQLFLLNSMRYKTTEDKSRIEQIKKLIANIFLAKDSQELMGIEGNISKLYFSIYFKNLDFKGRLPRCKTDEFNLLLDIGYNYLFNFIEANLELYGFDTYCGAYHKFFYQRKSLVCDIIEPFRAIVDRRIKKSYNLKQISTKDFKFINGQYTVKREFAKKYSSLFIKEILLYKEEIFLYVQGYYRSFIREKDISLYPEFIIK